MHSTFVLSELFKKYILEIPKTSVSVCLYTLTLYISGAVLNVLTFVCMYTLKQQQQDFFYVYTQKFGALEKLINNRARKFNETPPCTHIGKK